MIETVEYGLFLVPEEGPDILVWANEDLKAVQKVEGNMPAVQETVIKTRAVTKGEWVR
jgi:hypothetical protein